MTQRIETATDCLDQDIVTTAPCAADRRLDSSFSQPLGVVDRQVWTAAVDMVIGESLRDVEGRPASLPHLSKDNNASCATGPITRLFDDSFAQNDARDMELDLTISGSDGFAMHGHSMMRDLSRTTICG